jgi:hypothetical protein
MEKSLGETFPISTENIAAMLALIGKEEQNTSSPTAIVMLSGLKNNLKILFDKLCSKKLDYAMVRLGKGIELDPVFFEYAAVPKMQGMSKTIALGNVMNTLQQTFGKKLLKVISQEESSQGYEFLVEVREY